MVGRMRYLAAVLLLAFSSAASAQAQDRIILGFAQGLYTISESQNARVCVGVLFGTIPGLIPTDAGDIILTLTVDEAASSAERGVDYTFTSVEHRMRNGDHGDRCVSITIIDDDIPEGDEDVRINLSAAWETPNDIALEVSPAATTVAIADDDNVRVRVEAGRLDEDDVFSVESMPSVMEEVLSSSSRSVDPLLLRVSFWTDETTSRRFIDNRGGRRLIAMSLNKTTDSAQWRNLNSDCADARFRSYVGDGCLAAHEGNADIVLSLTSAARDSGFSRGARMRYDRNGRHEFYVEVWARFDGEMEGEEILTIDPTTLFVEDETITRDDNYISDPRNAPITVRIRDLAPSAELSVRIEINDDVRLDTAANLGAANAVKVADVVIGDGGADSLIGHITGVNVSGADADGAAAGMRFVLTEDGQATPLNFPLTVADGGEARFDLYAFLAEGDATGITDGATVTVTVDMTAADSAGNVLYSRASQARATALVAYEVVGTQLSTSFMLGLSERNGEYHWDIRGAADTGDLHEWLALTDAHGNQDLDDYAAADNFQYALVADDSNASVARKTIPLFGEGRYIRVATRTDYVSSRGFWRTSLSLADVEGIKTIKDRTRLQVVVWHAQLPSAQRVRPKFTLNYIADAAEIDTSASSLTPEPIATEQSVSLSGVSLRAYNIWSGQTDLEAMLGTNGDGDITSQIEAAGSVDCYYAVVSGVPECEITDVQSATAAAADGVWTFSNPIVFTPALTSGAPTPIRARGRLSLNVALPWVLPSHDDNFTAPAMALISSAAFKALDIRIVLGFVQGEYTISESRNARICAGALFGSIPGLIPEDAGDLILTFTADETASSAERGGDYTFTPVERRMRNGDHGDRCVDVTIIDDDIPEGDENVQINLSAAWETPNNDITLEVSPAAATIAIADDDNVRVRVEAGRLDDDDVFSVESMPSVMEEVLSSSSRSVDPLLLRVSFWTDETTSRRFIDNRGGRRVIAMSLNKNTDSAQLHNLNSDCADARFRSYVGDGCLAAHEGNADVVLSLTSAAGGSGFSRSARMRYDRNGRHEFYVEVWGRLDGEIEGEEILTIDPTTLFVEDETITRDNNYISDPRNAPITVRVRDGEMPEVRYFDAAGERVAEFSVVEDAADMSAFRVGVYAGVGAAALNLKEPFAFSLAIAAPAAVVFIDDGDSADGTEVGDGGKRMTFSFAAGAAVEHTFEISAPRDSNAVAESGTLIYTHQSGAANIAHPAALPFNVTDAFSQSLSLRAEQSALTQTAARADVVARFVLLVVDNLGEPSAASATVNFQAQVSPAGAAVATAPAALTAADAITEAGRTLEVNLSDVEAENFILTLSANSAELGRAHASVSVLTAPRRFEQLRLAAPATLTATTPFEILEIEVGLGADDNYGDAIAVLGATLEAVLDAGAEFVDDDGVAQGDTARRTLDIGVDGAAHRLRLRLTSSAPANLTLSLSADGVTTRRQLMLTPGAGRLRTLSVAGPEEATQAVYGEPLIVSFEVAATDDYGEPIAVDVALSLEVVGTLLATADLHGDAALTPQAFNLAGGRGTVMVRVDPRGRAFQLRLLAASGDIDARDEVRVVGAISSDLRLALAGPAKVVLGDGGRGDFVLELSALDANGDYVEADNVSLTITQTDGVVSALSPATLSLGAMQPARVAVSISAAPLGDADWTLRVGHATLIDADLTVRLLRGPQLLDVNKDSDLELGELILIQRHLLDPDAGARNLSRNMRRADANGMEALLNNLRQLRMDRALDLNDDGEGDTEDMRLLIRYAFGLESTLPPEFDVDKARALLRGE